MKPDSVSSDRDVSASAVLPAGSSAGSASASDRELLAWAAKAAGSDAVWNHKGFLLCWSGEPRKSLDKLWRPLDDDGDALRLAVKLSLNLYLSECGQIDVDATDTLTEEFGLGDPYAATRRAIVRAAAEIAKQECTQANEPKHFAAHREDVTPE